MQESGRINSLEEDSAHLKRKTSVLDESTIDAMELGRLYQILDSTVTTTGSTHLKTTILNPSISAEEISQKQEALREIRANDRLRTSLQDFVQRVQKLEQHTMIFLGVSENSLYHWSNRDYNTLPNTRELLINLPIWAKDISEPESNYLKTLKHNITRLEGSGIHHLARGPIVRHLFQKKVYGIRELKDDLKPVSPLPYYNSKHKIGQTALGLGIGGLFAHTINSAMGDISKMPSSEQGSAYFLNTIDWILGLFGGGIIGNQIGESRDKSNFHRPIRQRFFTEGQQAYQAIGAIDELLAFDTFGKALKFSTIPTVCDEQEDFFMAQALINPVQSLGLARKNRKGETEYDIKPIQRYIPNDVKLGAGQNLTFLTGPNSGGKTSLAKAILHARVLGQIGCYIPALAASINIAHQLRYQVGVRDTQADEEGGLGTQFLQTKDTLFNGNNRTFLAIDDLIEGTRVIEKLKHTRNQLYGFLHNDMNVLYITHHDELAREFDEREVGRFIQVEFEGEEPTHRIISGISTNSHSDLVAKRTGLDEEAIKTYLVQKGKLNPSQELSDINRFKRKYT